MITPRDSVFCVRWNWEKQRRERISEHEPKSEQSRKINENYEHWREDICKICWKNLEDLSWEFVISFVFLFLLVFFISFTKMSRKEKKNTIILYREQQREMITKNKEIHINLAEKLLLKRPRLSELWEFSTNKKKKLCSSCWKYSEICGERARAKVKGRAQAKHKIFYEIT